MPALLFSAPSRAPRQSNHELLRINALLLVLVLHSDYHTLGAYEPAEFHSQPVPTATRLLVEQGALVCVNVFVLLSGWFGIRARARGVASLLFQYYFFGLLLFLVLAFGISETFALKFALPIVGGLQMLSIPLAKNIIKSCNLHDK